MSELFVVLAAVWGVSGAVVTVIVVLDERSHRRRGSAEPLHDVAIRPAAAAARSKVPAHGDRALA
ncbi:MULTISPECIES: hypothetical protein [Aeromicrobium]|uniref:hypothetical protein n=1 Tax=Aeromicrobium TaxID=2040 RepID=UPI0006F1DC31|nr:MULTISPECIES: hypothetical protein [Aeromicrobium]KQX74277.1 hypothetical protein ASD10_03245 [Aeromicrobium sp. Root472D3]MBD8608539.1 hypothetical protein [Aeromicrobium sp. CFBP 8757]MCL8249795.1 hypothetical protein [Aeromicrobium fastidiosum]